MSEYLSNNSPSLEKLNKPLISQGKIILTAEEAFKHNTYGGVCAIKTDSSITIYSQGKRIYGEPDPDQTINTITPTNILSLTPITEKEINKMTSDGITVNEFHIFTFNSYKLVVQEHFSPQGSSGNDIDFYDPKILIKEGSKSSTRTNL